MAKSRTSSAESQALGSLCGQSGLECNSRFLREHCGWHGLMMDGGFQNSVINLNKEFITRENIVHLFQKYNVSHQVSRSI